MLEPDEIEDLVVAELGSSALFGARFRENAGRALLIPRARPGKRTPLWQQRLKSQSLLEVAKKYGEFPVILETYRECLRDVLDVPGLVELLTRLHRREITMVEVETATASPFASSLLFDYVATYMYEGDTPNAERRAAALSLDRDLLRELLGQEELRDLIDPGALERVEADLQCLSEPTRAANRDGLLDVLRRVGDLSLDEVSARVLEGLDPAAMLVGPARRAASRAGARQRRGALDRRRRRRACTATRWAPPRRAACRRRSWRTCPTRCPACCAATAPPTARSPPPTCAPATASTPRRRCASSSAPAIWSAASCAPAARSASGATPRSCAACAAPRWRCCARRSSPPRRGSWRAFCPPGRASTATRRRAPGSTGCARRWSRSRGWRCPPRCGSQTSCPRRVGAYSPTWMDQLCAAGEVVWIGAGALGRNSGRVALYFREDLALLGPPPYRGRGALTGEAHAAIRARLAAGACFFTDLLVDVDLAPRRSRRRCGTWPGRASPPTTRSRRCGRRG